MSFGMATANRTVQQQFTCDLAVCSHPGVLLSSVPRLSHDQGVSCGRVPTNDITIHPTNMHRSVCMYVCVSFGVATANRMLQQQLTCAT